MRMKDLPSLCGAFGALSLAACEPTQLYTGARTVVGINAAVNLEQTSGSLVIGYDRTFVAVVPRSVPTVDGRDAMSALVCSDLGVDGITIRHYRESIATGRAATQFANALSGTPTDRSEAERAMIAFFDCFNPRQQPAAVAGGQS